MQNVEVGNHRLSEKLEHISHSLRYFCSSKHCSISQGGLKQPWGLCAENEEKAAHGILGPKRPSRSAGVTPLAHKGLNFRRSWPESKGSGRRSHGWSADRRSERKKRVSKGQRAAVRMSSYLPQQHCSSNAYWREKGITPTAGGPRRKAALTF